MPPFNRNSISRAIELLPPRVFIYGSHGMGKTTFSANAEKPVFIQTEDGLGRLEVDHFPVAKKFGDVMQAIETLYTEDHPYKTVVIDSADWLANLIDLEIATNNDAKDLAYGKGAILGATYWREVLEALSALRSQRGMCVILTAHCQIKRFDSPEVEPYDRYCPKLQERSSALVQEWADCVLFANFRTIVRKDDVGFNKTVARGITTGERLLYTSEKPAYLAKNRYSLPESLPLSWEAFSAAISS